MLSLLYGLWGRNVVSHRVGESGGLHEFTYYITDPLEATQPHGSQGEDGWFYDLRVPWVSEWQQQENIKKGPQLYHSIHCVIL